jgi:hypothetical protein
MLCQEILISPENSSYSPHRILVLAAKSERRILEGVSECLKAFFPSFSIEKSFNYKKGKILVGIIETLP